MKLFWWNASKKQSTMVNNEKLGHTFSISKLLLTKMREDLPVCTGRYRSSKITSTRNSRSLTRAISQCRLPHPRSTHLTIPTTCHSLIDSITVAVIGSKKATPGFRNMCSDELILNKGKSISRDVVCRDIHAIWTLWRCSHTSYLISVFLVSGIQYRCSLLVQLTGICKIVWAI